ncbi:MAG TPA: BtrH N-terminal domain-containing protein [Pseudonocardiaceae bacterium]|nr:BtrH N-terminal domain-containing protein [Pseudonocardiaceae bacterium]
MRVTLDNIAHWRHDLTGCLHVTMAVLLGFLGHDPLEILGAGWGFEYHPGELRREEYYFPCRGRSLLSALAPHHPVSSTWYLPPDAGTGWQQVRSVVAAGRPVAVAADNYELPFRPAYQDVHTNHLITVFGFDDERGDVLVTDPVPPRFTGAIPIDVLMAARDSTNRIDGDRDLFFTGNPIANRWLTIDAAPVMPVFDRDFVRNVVLRNIAEFRRPDGGSGMCHGLDGQRRFLAAMTDRLAAGDDTVADEGFVVAGPALAVAGLHADWLAMAGRRLDWPRLVEAARWVDRVAHHWSAFRITVATSRTDPAASAAPLLARARALAADHERALTLLCSAVETS